VFTLLVLLIQDICYIIINDTEMFSESTNLKQLYCKRVKMKLALSYESMSAVPDEFKEAFTEKDGKFVISKSIEVKTEADVTAVQTAKDHVKAELSEAKEKLKAFDGIDPSKNAEMVNELDILRAKVKEGGSDEETINAIVKAKVDRATEQLTAENTELKANFDKEQGIRFNTELETSLMKELTDKVDSSFTGDSLALLKSNFKREATGEWMTKDGLGVGDAVSKFVEERPNFAPRNTGGGATGSTSATELSGRAKFNDLLKKQQGGEALNHQETVELSTLANQLKNEE